VEPRELPKEPDCRQQTGFRADKDLLNRFRSKLALEGLDMGPVLEGFIGSYVDDQEVHRALIHQVKDKLKSASVRGRRPGTPIAQLTRMTRPARKKTMAAASA